MGVQSKHGFGQRLLRKLTRELRARLIAALPVSPLSASGGFERGTPIDRLYIEAFLAEQADRIRGRTLEIGDNYYSRKFGGERVRQPDVLNTDASVPGTTVVGDLSRADTLPAEAFDCMILTQVLQYIHDLPSVVRTVHHALRPGGSALITVPAASFVVADLWHEQWQWHFSQNALIGLFAPTFGRENLELQSHGNCFAATAFFYGLAQEDVSRRKLEPFDSSYPIVVTLAVRKGASNVA
jgi:SAM-dependent methyltransferase